MSDDLEPPPVKRMRYNLRSSARSKSNVTTNETIAPNRPAVGPQHSTYRLRSRGRINEGEFPTVERRQKRKKPSLLTLNPDCVLKLFEYLNLVDLCAMAGTCTSMFNYAKYHFRLKHKNFDFASMYDGNLLDVSNATQLLRIFGDQIHTLKVSRDFFKDSAVQNTDTVSTQLLRSIADNCQQIVKVLALDGINFMADIMVDELASLFNSLEMLSLDQCSMYEVRWCDMKNLKVLKLKEVDGFDAYFWKAKFDKLEVVELNHLDIDVENLTEFILSVPTIKRLSIVKCGYITTAIFGAIKVLENLEELEFQLNRPNRSEEFHQRDLMHLTELKVLKVLRLYCNKKSVRQLIDGFCEKKIALEQLELAYGLMDVATVEAIVKLETVKALKLNNMVEFADYLMSPIAKGMSQLEEFHIKTEANITQYRIKEIVRSANRLTSLNIDAKDFSLKTDTYNAILCAVKDRKDDIRLAVSIYGDGNQTTVPVDVLKGPNEKWLKVDSFDRNANRLFQLYTWTSLDETDTEDEFDDEEEMMLLEAEHFRAFIDAVELDSDDDVEIEDVD